MRWLLIVPAVVLAVAFAAGLVAGLLVVAAVPFTRRLVARHTAGLRREVDVAQRCRAVREALARSAAETRVES